MSKNVSGRRPAEVARVICSSESLVQGSVMSELFQVRNGLGVSGPEPRVRCALMYSGGCFVFWFEGQSDAVEKVLERTSLDKRHHRLTVIHRSRGAPMLAEPLSVVTTQGAETAFQRRLARFHQDKDDGVAHEPAAIWCSLVAPCTVAAGRGQPKPPHRHAALVSAEDNGPIDLLRKLGERCGSRVVYQRFASAKSYTSDVGLAYVDLRIEQSVIRVHLLSRRALGQPMVRHSLEGLDEIVMLMGSRPAAAIELAASVADCVKAMATRPSICQVTERDEVAATISRLLQRTSTTDRQLQVMQLREPQLEGFLLSGAVHPAGQLQGAHH